MSETLEGFISLSITSESELFQGICKLSGEIFTDNASRIQHQVLSFGLYQTLK